MKKLLALAALCLSLWTWAPATQASNYEGFDVSEILDLDADDNELNASTDIYENLQEDAKKNNTSIAGAVILRAINLLTLLIGTFTFLMIMIGGFMMVTAGGDENRVDRAKGILTHSILGCLLAFFAYFITVFVQSFFY